MGAGERRGLPPIGGSISIRGRVLLKNKPALGLFSSARYDHLMNWADKRITKKVIAYATQGYQSWARVSEAVGRVAGTVAARVEAPFFDVRIYCSQFNWWLAYPYSPDDPFPQQDPVWLSKGEAYEADVWLAVTRFYAARLAGEIGSSNPLLVDPDMGFMLKSHDGRDEERVGALRHVAEHLTTVAQGIGHPNTMTQRMAAEILEAVQATIREAPSLTAGAKDTAEELTTVSPSPVVAERQSEPTRPQELRPVQEAPSDEDLNRFYSDFPDDESFDEDDEDDEEEDESEFWGKLMADNRAAFDALPVATLCKRLGIAPSFSDPFMQYEIFLFGGGNGLQIGNEGGVDLFLTDSDDWWVLRVVERDAEFDDRSPDDEGEGEDEFVDEWPVCPRSVEAGEVAYLVRLRLRELAYSSTGKRLHAAISALLYWAALTSRAKDALWAIRYAGRQSDDEDVSTPSCISQALTVLLQGRYLSTRHRLEIRNRFDTDYHLAFDYFGQ